MPDAPPERCCSFQCCRLLSRTFVWGLHQDELDANHFCGVENSIFSILKIYMYLTFTYSYIVTMPHLKYCTHSAEPQCWRWTSHHHCWVLTGCFLFLGVWTDWRRLRTCRTFALTLIKTELNSLTWCCRPNVNHTRDERMPSWSEDSVPPYDQQRETQQA